MDGIPTDDLTWELDCHVESVYTEHVEVNWEESLGMPTWVQSPTSVDIPVVSGSKYTLCCLVSFQKCMSQERNKGRKRNKSG